MTTQNRRLRKSLQSSLVLLGCACIGAYFGHHAIYGKYGLEAQTRLIDRSAELSRKIGSLEAVHARLLRQVQLLRTEPPAPDLVEEIARRDLGYAYPGERILLHR